MLEPASTETVKVSSPSILHPLVRPLFSDVLGIFPGRFRGTRMTFKHCQLTAVSFLTHGAGSSWDDQVQGSDLFGLDWPTGTKHVDDGRVFW